MPHYQFRPHPLAPAAAVGRTLDERVGLALQALARHGIDVAHDPKQLRILHDQDGDLIRAKVGTQSSIGWHLQHADLLSWHGLAVTREQSTPPRPKPQV